MLVLNKKQTYASVTTGKENASEDRYYTSSGLPNLFRVAGHFHIETLYWLYVYMLAQLHTH